MFCITICINGHIQRVSPESSPQNRGKGVRSSLRMVHETTRVDSHAVAVATNLEMVLVKVLAAVSNEPSHV